MYRPEDLTPADIEAWLRANIGRLLPGGYEPVSLMLSIAEECLRLTNGTVSVGWMGSWLCLQSEVDWLAVRNHPFETLAPLPQLGPNTASLVAATIVFERRVATWESESGRWQLLKGQDLPEGPLRASTRRAIALGIA